MNTDTQSIYRNPVYTQPIPIWLRWLGLKSFHEDGCHRMVWGELRYGSKVRSLSVALCMFDEHYSFHVQVPWLFNVFIRFPFLQRFHRCPDDMLESWGFTTCDNAIHFHWGNRYKIFGIPWFELQFESHEVMRSDGSWVPFVGCWEHDKEPDGRHYEAHPYKYILKNGTVQDVVAKCSAHRRIYHRKWFPWFKQTMYCIDVEFSAEVGERAGDWKGGCVSTSHDLKPGETIRKCLLRMQDERRFK